LEGRSFQILSHVRRTLFAVPHRRRRCLPRLSTAFDVSRTSDVPVIGLESKFVYTSSVQSESFFAFRLHLLGPDGKVFFPDEPFPLAFASLSRSLTSRQGGDLWGGQGIPGVLWRNSAPFADSLRSLSIESRLNGSESYLLPPYTKWPVFRRSVSSLTPSHELTMFCEACVDCVD